MPKIVENGWELSRGPTQEENEKGFGKIFSPNKSRAHMIKGTAKGTRDPRTECFCWDVRRRILSFEAGQGGAKDNFLGEGYGVKFCRAGQGVKIRRVGRFNGECGVAKTWTNEKITVLKTFCVENFTGPGSFSSRQGGVGREFLVYLKSTTSIAFTTRWRQVTYFVILDL